MQGSGSIKTVYNARLKMAINPSDNGSTLICEAQHPASTAGHPLRSFLPLNVVCKLWFTRLVILFCNRTNVILDPPGPPQIEGHNGKILKSGERLSLECSVKNSNPPAYVNWYRNGELIDGSYTVNSEVNGFIKLFAICSIF